MLNLENVTLYSVDCKYYEKTILAINECLKNVKFGRVVFLSDRKPDNIPEGVDFIEIEKISSLDEYSAFMLEKLPDYIDTEFCMCVHYDGWIINPDKWRDEFLDYDYIGAPWWLAAQKHFMPPGDKYRVGNGGVSIRSKKLLKEVQAIAPNTSCHEDSFISITAREHLEGKGITYAPLHLAKYFSQERLCDDLDVTIDDVFAFHGKAHTPAHVERMKYITGIYYRDVVTKRDNDGVKEWLSEEAGSQDPNNFFGKFRGNLNLQQIPDEYVNLLDFLRNSNIKSYLELGVGNGGSFFVDGLFLGEKCKKFHAVDNIGYAHTHIKQTEEKILNKVNLLADLLPESEVKFFNSTTDDFFENNEETYDCIFIDADHSYKGVKSDYDNALRCLNEGGTIIFHDIGNKTTGVAECWAEVKDKARKVEEYLWKPDHVDFYNCGIGIYYT
jgi:predicted O-methyltransferase YrrM